MPVKFPVKFLAFFALLFLLATASFVLAAGAATVHIKAIAIGGNPYAASPVWGENNYSMSCADAANTTCGAEGINTSCSYTFSRQCTPQGDYYSYADFTGLNFSSPTTDTVTGNTSRSWTGCQDNNASYPGSWTLLYTASCASNSINCSADNATFYNNTCNTGTCAWSNASTSCSGSGCCTVNCTASLTGGCATTNNNSACTSPPSTACNTTLIKTVYSLPATCGGCGANGATGVCSYTATNTTCGVGSGCCSAAACVDAGSSDGCCPNGGIPGSDADCLVTLVSPTENDNAYVSKTYYYVNATFVMANSTGCGLEINGASNVTMTQAVGSTSYCYLNRTGQSDGNYSYKVYVNTSNSSGTYWGASSSRLVILDPTLPTGFSFVSPTDSNNSWIARNYYYVNVTFTETNPSSCWLEVGGSNVSMTRSGTNCYLNRTSQSDASYSYKVYVNDSANNWNASGQTVNMDTGGPSSFSFVSPTESNNSNKSQSYYYVNVTFSDANPSSCYLEINNSVNVSMTRSGTNCYLNRTSQSDGYYFYRVFANDSANSWGVSGVYNVTLDTTAPTAFSFPSPTDANDSIKVRTYYYVNATFTEIHPTPGTACFLEVNHLNGTLTNTTMTRSSTNCYFNKTSQLAKNYTYKVYANDTANNWNVSFARQINLENFTTSGSLLSATPYSADVGATDYKLNITLNLSNQPIAQMQTANISYSSNLPAGWSLNATLQQCNTIAKGASCARTFQLTIPAGTAPTSKVIYWKAEWTENDNTTHSPILYNSTTITIAQQTGLVVGVSSIAKTVNPNNTADITQTVANSTGNSPLQNLSFYLTPSSGFVTLSLKNVSNNDCTRNSATNWTCTRLCGGSGCDPVFDPNNMPFNVSITVPRGTAAQNYTGTLNVTSANGGYVQVPVNISVPSFGEWTLNTTAISASFGLEETGGIGSVLLNNSGNINLTFSASCSSLSTSVKIDGAFCNTAPEVFIAKQTTVVSNITLALGQSANASFNITFSDATATPTSNQTNITLTITDRRPRAEYVVFSPSIAEVNNNVTITANISDDQGISDSLMRFQITPASGSPANYTPARISGSANNLIGNFSYNFSGTSTSGTYNLTIYSADNDGKYNVSVHNFTVAGTTSIKVNSNTSSYTVSGITQEDGAWFLVNVSFNNTGNAKAYYANATATKSSGWNATFQNFSDNNNLSAGSVNTTLVNISVPAGTASLQYSVAPILSWKNANTSANSSTTAISVTVSSNPRLRFWQNASNYSVFQNESNSSQLILQSFGNSNASSINFTCLGNACSTFNISFNQSNGSTLTAGGNLSITMAISVPAGTTNGTYNFSVYANASSNTSTLFSSAVIVPPSTGWSFSPTSLTLYRVGSRSDNYSGISLWNYGNQNQTYSLSISGNLSSIASLNQTTISNLQSQSSQTVWLSLVVPNSTNTYSGFIVADNSTETKNISITVKAYQFSVVIASPTTASPTSQLDAGDNVSITTRVLLSGSEVVANTSFNASVSNQSCPISSNTTSGNLWTVICVAPTISSLHGNLNLSANYSIETGWLWASTLETSAVTYRDTNGPTIGNYSLPTIDLGNGNTIQLNMTDADQVLWTNVAIHKPSGTQIHLQNYSSPNISITLSSAVLTEAGDYAVLVNSSDNNANVNNTIVYFEVVDAKTISGSLTDATNSPLSANFYFKRPNTPDVLVQNSTEADGDFSVRVGKRTYDFELEYAGNSKIVLKGTSINSSTSSLLSADVVPNTAATIPGSLPVKVVVAEPAVVYSSAVLNVSYSDSLSNVIYEGNIHLFKCSDWNYGSRACRSSWTRVSTASVDKATHRVVANISSFSAYAVVENYCGDSVCRPDLGETYASCPNDCPQSLNLSANNTVTEVNNTYTTTIPGAASVSLQQYVSQLEELRKNPSLSNDTREEIASLLERLKKLKDDKDLSGELLKEIQRVIQKAQEELGIRMSTQNIYVELFAGESTAATAHLKNTLNYDAVIQIYAEGEAARFISFNEDTIKLAPQEETDFAVIVEVPIETNPGIMSAELKLKNDRGLVSIPVNIRVLEPQERLLDLKIRTVTQGVQPGENAVFDVNLFNLGEIKNVDLTLTMQLLTPSADSVVQELEEEASFENSLSITRKLQVPSDVQDGKYILQATAKYYDKFGKTREATNIDYVYVQKSVFAMTVFGIPLVLMLAIAGISILLGSYAYYLKAEAEKRKRYLEKIDFTKLPAAGERSATIGKIAESTVRAFFELDKLSTHVLAAGATGSGKTVAAQVLVEEALKKGVAVAVFDPTAQWTGFLRAQKNAQMLGAYKEFNMPASEAQAFKGTIHVVKSPDEEIDFKALTKPGEITVFVLNKLKQNPLPDPSKPLEKTQSSEMELFVANTVKKIFDSKLQESKAVKLILVYDEVHRLLPKFGGSGEGFTQIERAAREFRKWGVGLILISQVLSDFVGEIKANIGTEIQLRTKYEGDLDRVKLKYGEDTMKSIVKAKIGEGMIQNSDYNRGRPYFISFRPLLHNVNRLSDSELASYGEYDAKIKKFEILLEKLKAAQVDVFDLELELDLARDKLKKGAFNIVDIYLDSLAQKASAAEKKAFRK